MVGVGKCSEILAMIKLLYNPRVNKVFTSLHFTTFEVLFRVLAEKNMTGDELFLNG